MLGSLGLLIDVCVVDLHLELLPLHAVAWLMSAISLAIYVVSDSPAFERIFVLRWAAYAAVALLMLPSMVPLGLLAGDLISHTGVWRDPPGSHADADILGPMATGALGLLAGPFLSVWSISAVSRRIKTTRPA